MSGEGEGQTNEPELVEEPKVDVDDLTARMERMEASNKRLLEESKTWKTKYQDVRTAADDKITGDLQRQNDFKGLYEKSQATNEELRVDLLETKKAGLETSLQFEVARHGRDAEDVDILLAAVKTKKREVLGYDKEAKKWEGVDQAIEELRKSNPGLFKSNVVGMENGRPQSAVTKEKTVEELIVEDPMAVLKEQLAKIL